MWDGDRVTDQDARPVGEDAGLEAAPGARRARRTRGPLASVLRETAIVLVAALVLSWVVQTFLAQAFLIPSASMHGALLEGDRVLVTKLAPGPFDVHRGDVVVFADPGGWLVAGEGDHLIKRVIGLPGDRVVSTGDGAPLTVNGVAVDETPYLAAGASPSEIAFDEVVPAGSLWVMGDNRQHSRDSRWHLGDPGGGFLPLDDVVGTAFLTVWPLDRLHALRNPGAVFADVPDPA
ncbi:signal peptidase I [Cellulomonas hominis]|nr:signal peptidase I [Cellulomonas hominis]